MILFVWALLHVPVGNSKNSINNLKFTFSKLIMVSSLDAFAPYIAFTMDSILN